MYFKILFVPRFIVEPLTMFCETVVGKYWSRLSKVERELATTWEKVAVAQFKARLKKVR